MRLSELIQLLEAMPIDDFSEFAVMVMVNAQFITTNLHQFSVLCSVRFPCRNSLAVGVAVVGELCPDVAHRC